MSRALSVGYQHISNDLRQQIAKGRLKPGAALPSEARLSEKYNVSRMTVRQGLRVLEDAGLIEVIPAKGRIVSRPGSRPVSKVQGAQQANAAARGKQNGQALLLMGAGGADFTHPYLAGIHEGLRATFEAAGIEWQLRIEPVSGDPLADIDERFSVAVVFGVYDAPRLAALKNSKVPVVLLNQRPLHGGDAVSTDNFAGGYIAAEEILKRGHRRIVYFHWVIDDPAFRDRYLGFRQACEDAGFGDQLRVIPRPPWAEHDVRLREILNGLLAGPDAPTAFFACTDEWASRVCAILETRGVKVPQDVSVVGFDRYVPNVFRGIPELATIEQPGLEVGICAARKAIARMSEPNLPGSVELLVPRWVEGKTLGVPKGEAASNE